MNTDEKLLTTGTYLQCNCSGFVFVPEVGSTTCGNCGNFRFTSDGKYITPFVITSRRIHDSLRPFPSLDIYLGDDNGDRKPNDGTVYWCESKEDDVIGHGDTPEQAVRNCLEGVDGKRKIIADRKQVKP